jgi:hypothetical protein
VVLDNNFIPLEEMVRSIWEDICHMLREKLEAMTMQTDMAPLRKLSFIQQWKATQVLSGNPKWNLP